jgi:hypothetical protein
MFKDTKEGETHSYNDGCGEPAHNPKLPQHIEVRLNEILDKTLIEGGFTMNEDDNWLPEEEAKLRIKSFIATILEEERERIINVINKYDDTRTNSEANETVRDIINLIKEDEPTTNNR